MSEYERSILESGIPTDPFLRGYHSLGVALRIHEQTGKYPEHLDRFAFIRKYGYAIPNDAALDEIAKHSPILEVGAGNGYWAYELTKRGVDVVATDKRPVPVGGRKHAKLEKVIADGSVLTAGDDKFCGRENNEGEAEYAFDKSWHAVLEMSAVDAIEAHPDRVLLMIWPSYDKPWAAEALKTYKGDVFLYVGEYRESCANDAFFDHLEHEWHEESMVKIPKWAGIHDRLWVFRRKPI